jgi:hypothetical protein
MSGFASQKEATLMQLGGASGVVTVIGQKLVMDSVPVPMGKHWVVENVTANCTLASAAYGVEFSGIYACPPGTPAVEGPANPLPGPIPNFQARPLRLDVFPFDEINNANRLIMVSHRPCTLPQGWFLRAIVQGPTPNFTGPGVGSTGQMNFTYVQRDNCEG